MNQGLQKKTKTYKIHYYIPRVGADGKQGSIASIMERIIAIEKEGKLAEVRVAGSSQHQVRINQHKSTDCSIYNGAFVRFRDELPIVGSRKNTLEKTPQLGVDEELLEKNYFVLFAAPAGVEIIAYQTSMEGSNIAGFARYLTHINGAEHTISFDEVFAPDTAELLRNGVMKSIDFIIAKPRSKKYAPDPEDTWTKDAIDELCETQATRVRTRIYTTSKKTGLMSNLKAKINFLLKSPYTKKLEVKLSDIDHPIDLFGDRLFDKITVDLVNGIPDAIQIFTEIAAAKKSNTNLQPYLVGGNEALE